MRFVADPLSEDPGVPSACEPPEPSPPAAETRKKKTSLISNPAAGVAETGEGTRAGSDGAEGGRVSILETLRGCVGSGKGGGGGGGAGGGKGKGAASVAAGSVDVSAWKGLGGDDHVAGEIFWRPW